MRMFSKEMLSDDKRVKGKTWRNLKESVMHDDFTMLEELTSEEERVLARLKSAQEEQEDMLELRKRPD